MKHDASTYGTYLSCKNEDTVILKGSPPSFGPHGCKEERVREKIINEFNNKWCNGKWKIIKKDWGLNCRSEIDEK